MKKCTICNQIKSLDNFHLRQRNEDGHTERCKQCARNAHRARYEFRLRARQCIYCGCDLNQTPNNSSKACAFCSSKKQRFTKRWKDALKSEVILAYGGKCSCTKCDNPSVNINFLTIDHPNNDGAEHRRSLNMNCGGGRFYAWLKKNNYPPEYQVLCFNCNCGKSVNGGICPHLNKSESSV